MVEVGRIDKWCTCSSSRKFCEVNNELLDHFGNVAIIRIQMLLKFIIMLKIKLLTDKKISYQSKLATSACHI